MTLELNLAAGSVVGEADAIAQILGNLIGNAEKYALDGKFVGMVNRSHDLTADQRGTLRNNWRLADGSRAAYAGALDLVQENAQLISRQWQQALPGDLLFFDQGDDQHLMIWMGRYLAYHTGSTSPGDNGLRAADIKELLDWKDTRWQPVQYNPNFAGIYRFSFLSDS